MTGDDDAVVECIQYPWMHSHRELQGMDGSVQFQP
jgi:hypothetical protein